MKYKSINIHPQDKENFELTLDYLSRHVDKVNESLTFLENKYGDIHPDDKELVRFFNDVHQMKQRLENLKNEIRRTT